MTDEQKQLLNSISNSLAEQLDEIESIEDIEAELFSTDGNSIDDEYFDRLCIDIDSYIDLVKEDTDEIGLTEFLDDDGGQIPFDIVKTIMGNFRTHMEA